MYQNVPNADCMLYKNRLIVEEEEEEEENREMTRRKRYTQEGE